MKVEYLRYFIAVAKNLNFTKAAQECHIAQTAMSRHIAALENELDVRLFERDNRNVRLTPAGISFYNDVLFFLKKYEEATNKLTLMKDGVSGILQLGIGSFESYFVSEILKRFHTAYPNIEVNVTEFAYSQLWDNIQNGMLDVIFPYPSFKDMVKEENLLLHPLFNVEYCVVVSDNHPYAQKNYLTAKDFASQCIVTNAEESGPNSLQQFYINSDRVNVHPKKLLRSTSLNNMFTLVKADYGMGFIPHYFKPWLPKGLVMLRQKAYPTAENFALSGTINCNPATTCFINFLKTCNSFFKSLDCQHLGSLKH